MMHSVLHRGEASSSDESTTDLFSPVQGRMQSLHNFDTPETPDGAERLPRLADNSWIGAQVSPIPSMDEEDMELDRVTEPYQRAMQHFGTNERSALLGKRNIHPMWNDDFFEDAKRVVGSVKQQPPIWGKVIVGASTIHFFCIGLHDFYLWYVRLRRGVQLQYSLAWSLPWLGPSARILLRFGAFCPGKILWQHQWYRVLTSFTLCCSITELAIVGGGWWQLEKTAYTTIAANSWRIWWPILFISSIGTGQLWMAAFGSFYSISGVVGWGTSGVLCATGVSRPRERMSLFMTATALVVMNLLQSTSNVFGAVGATFFAWSLAETGLLPLSVPMVKENASTHKWSATNLLALVISTQLWLIPILYIIFWKKAEEPPTFDSSYPNS